jgi:hypothetical protein
MAVIRGGVSVSAPLVLCVGDEPSTLVGWSPYDCTPGVHGHTHYTCRFLVEGVECGGVLSSPPCRDPSAGPTVLGLGVPRGQELR